MSSSETGLPGITHPQSTTASSSSIPPTDAPAQMASVVQASPSAHLPMAGFSPHERPRLPSISSINEFRQGRPEPSLLPPSRTIHSYHYVPSAALQTSSRLDQGPYRVRQDEFSSPAEQSCEPQPQPSLLVTALNPLKRPYGNMTPWPERQETPTGVVKLADSLTRGAQPLHQVASPAYSEASASPYHFPQTTLPRSSRSPLSDYPTPARTHSLAATTTTDYSGSHPHRSIASRCSLHVRQQPRAARAGPDGKDRRAIDPPPVLQLLINDFDPNSEEDLNELRSSFFVVHCRLVSAQWPARDLSTLSSTNDDGSVEVQRLLLGTSVASPFFCLDDPDRESMPTHPQTKAGGDDKSAPPSPTSRFIIPRSSASKPKNTRNDTPQDNSPGTFFIFADLSIRRAGEYRLEFCLMKIEPSTMVAGSKLPILHSVTSQVFRVVNAKDFDQVQPSTNLVKGLLDRGAGFPLKLKKGTRESGRRRDATGSEGGGDEDEDEEDDEEE